MIKRVLIFAKRFLMPHFHWLLITFITGLITAAASGLGVPLLVKFVFPIVFYNGEGELPLLMQYVPSFKEMEHATLLLLACASMPLIFAIRGVAMWANHVVVNVLGLRILETLRTTVFHHVQQLPIAYLEGKSKGDLVSRIVADFPATCSSVRACATHIRHQLHSGHGLF